MAGRWLAGTLLLWAAAVLLFLLGGRWPSATAFLLAAGAAWVAGGRRPPAQGVDGDKDTDGLGSRP